MSETKTKGAARARGGKAAKGTKRAPARRAARGGPPAAPAAASTAPVILHLGEGSDASRADALGFTAVMLAPYGRADRPVRDVPDQAARDAVREAAAGGLDVYCDLPWHAHAEASPLPAQEPSWFPPEGARTAIDPRGEGQREARCLLTERAELHGPVASWIASRAKAIAEAGARGVRLPQLWAGDEAFWRAVTGALREAVPGIALIGDGLGGPFGATLAAERAGFDLLMDSACWWDGRADWFLDQRETLDTPTLGFPQAPEGDDLGARTGGDLARAAAARTARAVLTSTGLLVPAGLLDAAGEGYAKALPDILRARREAAWLDEKGPLAPARGGLVRTDGDARTAPRALGYLEADEPSGILAAAGGQLEAEALTAAGDATLVTLRRRDASRDKPRPPKAAARTLEQLASVRVAIEDVYPVVDGGRFPAKRIVGDTLVVGADVFSDGHDLVAADLILTEAGQPPRRVPMTKGLNDRWGAEATLTAMGTATFHVEGWRDDYASWVSEVTKKRAAGVDVSVEAVEGREVAERSLAVAEGAGLSEAQGELARMTREGIEAADGTDAMIAVLTNPALGELLRAHGERRYACRTQGYPLTVDRRQARFSSWYELFPRSMSGSMDRHGTFDDVIAKLPYVKDLGFDVLYFPPIHPIGKTNRKGKNNSLKAEPGDVGSPYAIGSEEGGYKAVHPELGTLEDFGRLVDAASRHGLEIALDIALNCSPDHPWIERHPEWFEHRPDGTIKFAENPPKKYEDIVNLSYYGEAIPSLWEELRDTFVFWCERGVRMFRIDNPHTKPYPLWEWLIAEVKARFPDALFLSEAFTRPKVMARLAKLGFSQSYTYFTWRNAKWEMEAYVRELTTAPLRDVMNPNFFMNTPDINPVPLQTNNRAAHVARMVLASSLSASWGMYNGVEIIESTVLPGKEEYLDSEKYQLRVWDMDRPGHMKDEVRLMNRLRSRHPAMQEHGTVRFLTAWNDQVSWYAKRTPDLTDYLLFAVTYDYEREQRATCELPLWEFGLPDDASIAARDLVSGHDFTWAGKFQDITLGPDRPFAAFQLFGPTKQGAAPLYADPKADT